VEAKREVWSANLGAQGYRDLLGSTAVIATWDDHEVENDWGSDPAEESVIEAGKAAFHEHTPTRSGAGAPLYRSLRWADTLEIFVLDARSGRDPETGAYLGNAQFDWFVEAIQSSTAVFKLILNSVPFANFSDLLGSVQVEDRWDGFPEARQAVLDALEGIPNIYFISGDFHMGLVCHVESEGFGWEIYDILVGPGGQFPNPAAAFMAPNPQFPTGVSFRNFTRMVANPRTETLTVEFIDEEGVILESIVLPELS
jgi:alkaline phosphatase D